MWSLETGSDEIEHSDALSDEELEALALAAEPDLPLDADAVPWSIRSGGLTGLLPSWYMPEVAVRRSSGWRRPVVIAIVATLVTLEALGLCSIFGQVVIG